MASGGIVPTAAGIALATSGAISGHGCRTPPQNHVASKQHVGARIAEERLPMAGATELPQLVTEFVDLSKEYLRQETVEPAKQLGRFAGFVIGASFLFAIGGLLLAIAGTRGIIYLLPEGPNWSALGYILGALAIGVVIGIAVAAVGGSEDNKEV